MMFLTCSDGVFLQLFMLVEDQSMVEGAGGRGGGARVLVKIVV